MMTVGALRHLRNREDRVLLDEDVGAAFVDEGPLVAFETDAVAGVVALQVGDAEVLEDVADEQAV